MLGPLMQFYGGLTVDGFWRLRVDEMNALVAFRNEYLGAMKRR